MASWLRQHTDVGTTSKDTCTAHPPGMAQTFRTHANPAKHNVSSCQHCLRIYIALMSNHQWCDLRLAGIWVPVEEGLSRQQAAAASASSGRKRRRLRQMPKGRSANTNCLTAPILFFHRLDLITSHTTGLYLPRQLKGLLTTTSLNSLTCS